MAACLMAPARAHDIDSEVTVRAFVKPQADTLELIVRVPVHSLRDVEFPSRGPGYLDIANAEQSLRNAATMWLANFIDVYEDDALLPRPTVEAVQISFESDRSFASFEEAKAHVAGPMMDPSVNLPVEQVMLDALLLYPITSDTAAFSIRPGWERLGLSVLSVVRFSSPGHPERVFEFSGDPGIVRLDPRWHQAAWTFVKLGFEHILIGIDHLLFLLCLVIPFRKLKPLLIVVTSFTIAHSITLIASAMDLAPGALWFPPLIETGIAASIVYMALENIVGTTSVTRRWAMAFGFGLVHGFGFSFALRETLQFAGDHLAMSLVSFNVGVELGQILVLLILVPVLNLAFQYVVAERMGSIILSALVAHTAWHWMTERWQILWEYRNSLPAMNAQTLAPVVLVLSVVAMISAGIWYGVRGLRRRAVEQEVLDLADKR